MTGLVRAYLFTKADRIRVGVAERLSPPGTLVHDLDLLHLAWADVLDALAGGRRIPPPCSCTYYGLEPECPRHGQCAYEGHPGGRRECYCGGRR